MTESLDGGMSDADAAIPAASGPASAAASAPTSAAASAGASALPLVATDGAAPTPAPVDGADAALLALIDRLASLLDRSDLTELEVQVGATGLVLRKPEAIAPHPVAAGVTAGTPQAQDGAATGAGAGSSSARPADGPPARPAVMAPLSGIWYGSPAPGTAPYVSVGGEVAVGQVIGLIEAMKLFNEIKSDKAGRVVQINAENGKLVRAKQPLIEVEPL
jgi:acetyl-CoA carboxylase biotin carboxyl carrier protein